MATDALVPKHLAIRIHTAYKIFIVLDQFPHKTIIVIVNSIKK